METPAKKPADAKPKFIILGYRISKNSPKYKVLTENGVKKLYEYQMSIREQKVLEYWRMTNHEDYFAHPDYYVNRVLDEHKNVSGQKFYLISFHGYANPVYHYWRLESELEEFKTLIKDYEKTKGRSNATNQNPALEDSDEEEYINPDISWRDRIPVVARNYESDEEDDIKTDSDDDENETGEDEEVLDTTEESEDDEYSSDDKTEAVEKMMKVDAEKRIRTHHTLSMAQFAHSTIDTSAPRSSTQRQAENHVKIASVKSVASSENSSGGSASLPDNSHSNTDPQSMKNRPFSRVIDNVQATPKKGSSQSGMQAQTPRRRRLQLDDVPCSSNAFSPKRAYDKHHIPE